MIERSPRKLIKHSYRRTFFDKIISRKKNKERNSNAKTFCLPTRKTCDGKEILWQKFNKRITFNEHIILTPGEYIGIYIYMFL